MMNVHVGHQEYSLSQSSNHQPHLDDPHPFFLKVIQIGDGQERIIISDSRTHSGNLALQEGESYRLEFHGRARSFAKLMELPKEEDRLAVCVLERGLGPFQLVQPDQRVLKPAPQFGAAADEIALIAATTIKPERRPQDWISMWENFGRPVPQSEQALGAHYPRNLAMTVPYIRVTVDPR